MGNVYKCKSLKHIVSSKGIRNSIDADFQMYFCFLQMYFYKTICFEVSPDKAMQQMVQWEGYIDIHNI